MCASEILTEELFVQAKVKLKKRLGERRYEHSLNVVQVAQELAEVYDVDVTKARFAGLLHDWDKCLDDEQAKQRVKDLRLEVDPFVYEGMPWLLHGIIAAAELAIEMPELSDDVLQAIARHTSAACDMSDLDMVVYVADVIEPSRPYETMDSLRRLVGKVSLEELFLQTFRQVFAHLVDQYYMIHPDTIAVWNCYIQKERVYTKEKGNS